MAAPQVAPLPLASGPVLICPRKRFLTPFRSKKFESDPYFVLEAIPSIFSELRKRESIGEGTERPTLAPIALGGRVEGEELGLLQYRLRRRLLRVGGKRT